VHRKQLFKKGIERGGFREAQGREGLVLERRSCVHLVKGEGTLKGIGLSGWVKF